MAAAAATACSDPADQLLICALASPRPVLACLQAPAMPAEAEVSDAVQPSARSAGPWQQTTHGKGRVRPRKNAPPAADVPRLAAVAHRCAAAASGVGTLQAFPASCIAAMLVRQ